MEIWAHLTAFVFTNQLPSTIFFITVFWIWVATAGLALSGAASREVTNCCAVAISAARL
jgi:hypothetical protein